MSPSESSHLETLRLLAQMSGSPEIGLDAEEFEELIEGQDSTRDRIERMQRELQILHNAA